MKRLGVHIVSAGNGIVRGIDYKAVLFGVLSRSTTAVQADAVMNGLQHIIVSDLDPTDVHVQYFFSDNVNIYEDDLEVDLR